MAASRHDSLALLLLPALLAVLLLLPHGSALIKEGQLGDVDWTLQHVGEVQHAQFPPRGPKVFVATAAAVVACLHLRDGQIAWRQLLDPEEDAINALALLESPVGSVVTLSGGGRTLRAWAAGDGALLWEQHILSGEGAADEDRLAAISRDKAQREVALQRAKQAGGLLGGVALAVLPADSSRPQPLLVVHSAGTIQAFTVGAAGAEPVWHVQLEGWEAATHVRLAVDAEAVTAAAITYDWRSRVGSLSIARIPLPAAGETAAAAQQNTFTAEHGLQGPVHLGGDGSVAALTVDGQLCSVAASGGTSLSCHPVADGAEAAKVAKLHMLPTASITGGGIVADAAGVKIFRDPGSNVAASEFAGATAVSDVIATSAGPVVAVAGRQGDVLWTRIVRTTDWQVLSEERVEDAGLLDAAGAPLPVARVSLGTFARKDGEPGFRVLVTLADATSVLLQQGQLVWLRTEALADVLRTHFVELPSRAGGAFGGAAPVHVGLKERLEYQVLSLKDSVMLAKPEEVATLKECRSKLSTKHQLTRDGNGFRRLMLLLTASGKLAAVHNGGARLVWAADFGKRVDGSPHTAASAHLLPWRSSHDAQHAPEVLVLLQQGGGTTLAATINAHTGEVLTHNTLQLDACQVLEVPTTLKEGVAEQRVYLLGSCAAANGAPPAIAVLPDTPAARAAAAAAAPSMSFWRAEAVTGVLRGWGLNDALQAEERWAAARPAAAPALLAAVPRESGEPLHAAAKVLGDRSLKVKHLNRHALLVASGAHPGAVVDPQELQLHVELLDAVTGRPLFRQVHQGCRGPVHGVIAEHWAVYTYWNALERRPQVSVVELYETATFDLKTALLGDGNRTASSWALPELEVLRDSYFWAAQIKVAAVTATARGVTAKFLLFGTSADQVYLMDKRFLDPRRPRKSLKQLTPAEQEERLIPFSPLLPLAPNWFVTYSRSVARLKGIVTAPAAMESTSHVLAHGLDLFYTRITPAASFDGLAADFPFALLVLVTSSLAGGAYVLRGLASRRDVRRKWE